MATGIALIATGWMIGIGTVLVLAAAQWWHRRNAPDHVLFPELQATRLPRPTKRRNAA